MSLFTQPRGCTWHRLSAKGAPSPRWGHSLTWCGTHFVVFGGVGPAEDDTGESQPKNDVYILNLTPGLMGPVADERGSSTPGSLLPFRLRDWPFEGADVGGLPKPPAIRLLQ
ncbi:hypothetical protein Esti_000678 [Eimeria stiedai]